MVTKGPQPRQMVMETLSKAQPEPRETEQEQEPGVQEITAEVVQEDFCTE